MLLHNGLRGALQIANARVITQSFPEFVDGFGTCAGGRRNIGQFFHPAFPIRDYRFNLRLLQHDLGHPDSIRIARAAPGQIAGGVSKPVEQRRN